MGVSRNETGPLSLSFRLKDKNAAAFREFHRLLEKKTGFECTYSQTVVAAVESGLKALKAEGYTLPETGA